MAKMTRHQFELSRKLAEEELKREKPNAQGYLDKYYDSYNDIHYYLRDLKKNYPSSWDLRYKSCLKSFKNYIQHTPVGQTEDMNELITFTLKGEEHTWPYYRICFNFFVYENFC